MRVGMLNLLKLPSPVCQVCRTLRKKLKRKMCPQWPFLFRYLDFTTIFNSKARFMENADVCLRHSLALFLPSDRIHWLPEKSLRHDQVRGRKKVQSNQVQADELCEWLCWEAAQLRSILKSKVLRFRKERRLFHAKRNIVCFLWPPPDDPVIFPSQHPFQNAFQLQDQLIHSQLLFQRLPGAAALWLQLRILFVHPGQE